jgi:hypothetical protein
MRDQADIGVFLPPLTLDTGENSISRERDKLVPYTLLHEGICAECVFCQEDFQSSRRSANA